MTLQPLAPSFTQAYAAALETTAPTPSSNPDVHAGTFCRAGSAEGGYGRCGMNYGLSLQNSSLTARSVDVISLFLSAHYGNEDGPICDKDNSCLYYCTRMRCSHPGISIFVWKHRWGGSGAGSMVGFCQLRLHRNPIVWRTGFSFFEETHSPNSFRLRHSRCPHFSVASCAFEIARRRVGIGDGSCNFSRRAGTAGRLVFLVLGFRYAKAKTIDVPKASCRSPECRAPVPPPPTRAEAIG
ncbi:hypothetical protein SAMN05880593_1164 [Rhizobium sp. RU36D]|nr:hypothetical protein SAMN05880593_1164 [Rhizobium sp. RU36D]